MKPGTEVKIEWVDSHVSSIWEDELIYDFPHIFTRGILDKIDNELICVIPTNSDNGKKLSATFIPRGAIIKIYQASYKEVK